MIAGERLLIHTKGHSDHDITAFASLVRRYGVELVVDVRSQPFSKWAPQYNHEVFSRYLENTGFTYQYMGDVLGGRPSDAGLYERGGALPDYERVALAQAYQGGISQLTDIAGTRQTVIVCSEGDHLHCHRHLLIAQTLLARGIRVRHIQRNGTVVEGELVPRQLSLFG